MSTSTSWQETAANKRKVAYDLIPTSWRLSDALMEKYKPGQAVSVIHVPRESGILSETELDITDNYDALALVRKLASGQLTSKSVTTAFCKRAAISQQLTSCLTETFFDEALERATYLDEYLAREKKPVGPLHGLPISIKDSFRYKGHESTLGYVSFIGQNLPTENSALVQILLDLGAVLYVKTNVPQTLMTADSHNNVFGRTLNPHNLMLNAGGSSGGEGALVAMRGSVVGVGTDIGGSIRIPALCCGTYGFKPTALANRICYGGQASPGAAGSPGIIPCAGPLATSFRDLIFFVKTVTDACPWNYDSKSLFSPWRQTDATKILNIGVLPPDDPVYPLQPPVARALATAVSELEAAGHNVVHLKDSPSIEKGVVMSGHYFSLDNTKAWLKHINASGEPLVPSVIATKFPHQDFYTMEDLYKLNVEKAAYAEKWREVFAHNKIDVILGPGAENTAVPHDEYGMPPYTVVWNLLDYPSAIIPFLKADKTIDKEEFYPKNATRSYKADVVDGAPCAVQVSARPCADEECLAAASIVAEVLSKA